MWPELVVGGRQVSTSLALLFLTFWGSFAIFQLFLKGHLSFVQRLVLLALTAVAGIAGGRLFHVFVERWSYFQQHPSEIFTRFDGMTLYGAVGAAALAFYLLLRGMGLPGAARAAAWDAAAMSASLTTAVLRFACFAEGCCWGRVCKLPWAVQFYNERAHMPMLGVPVHPVQLYESVLAALLMGYLIIAQKKWPLQRGQLIWHYFLIYGLIRIFTETFRADAIRGAVLGGLLSTSQAISILMIAISLVQLYRGTQCKTKFIAAA
jgi:phosphatidylglycerol:prolipoprotein diacylglycerol transferase